MNVAAFARLEGVLGAEGYGRSLARGFDLTPRPAMAL